MALKMKKKGEGGEKEVHRMTARGMGGMRREAFRCKGAGARGEEEEGPTGGDQKACSDSIERGGK